METKTQLMKAIESCDLLYRTALVDPEKVIRAFTVTLGNQPNNEELFIQVKEQLLKS